MPIRRNITQAERAKPYVLMHTLNQKTRFATKREALRTAQKVQAMYPVYGWILMDARRHKEEDRYEGIPVGTPIPVHF